jgi:hypothetical protein
MAGYAKLFSTITASSLWASTKDAKILFVSMLASADQNGYVEASIPGLAQLAHLTIQEVETALAVLESPDPYSKNPDNEGRRLATVPGGWVLLNYESYRNRPADRDRKEYMREYMQEWRRKQDAANGKQSEVYVANSKPPLAAVSLSATASATAASEAKDKSKYTAAFAAWYETYPRHVGKGEAAAAYGRAIKRISATRGTTPSDAHIWLIGVTQTFAQSPAGTAGSFTPHPSTWLNQARYDDDPAEWQRERTNEGKPNGKAPGPGQRYDPTKPAGW